MEDLREVVVEKTGTTKDGLYDGKGMGLRKTKPTEKGSEVLSPICREEKVTPGIQSRDNSE